jgi:prolyl-tRNA synthetase
MKKFDYINELFTKTQKENPSDEESLNARLLIRAGYINKLSAGIYSFLPLGLKTLNKIEAIIREEMLNLGAEEVRMPALQPKYFWERTGRWNTLDVLYKLNDEICLGPTHEEVVTPLLQNYVKSYQDLPKSVFQIQDKFRNEKRARSGLLRGREFRMKDLYSFHSNEESLTEFYEQAVKAYQNIFDKLEIGNETILTYASGGTFSRYSHEFQLLSNSGEDTVYVDLATKKGINKEIYDDKEVLNSIFGSNNVKLEEKRAIEIGNIFKLGTKYSKSFGFNVKSSSNENNLVYMGCYGIGVTRLLGAIAEVKSDKDGLIMPKSISPYNFHVVVTNDSDITKQKLNLLLEKLSNSNLTALIDNRSDVRVGEKFKDADLIGLPYRVVIGKELGADEVEVKVRQDRKDEVIRLSELVNIVEI